MNDTARTLRFEVGGLRASDLTPEDVRLALNLPRIAERKVVFGQPGEWSQSNRHKALVNVQTGKLYGIHSDQYRTVRHEEGLLDIMKTIDESNAYGPIEWTARGMDEDRKVQLVGRFTDRPTEIVKGDLIDPTINYHNSYDGTWGERFSFGAHRLVCSNGMVVGVQFSKMNAFHVGERRPEDILPLLGDSMARFAGQVARWRAWVERPLQIAHVEDSIEVLELNQKERELVVSEVSENEEMDLWGFYNVLTALVTHRMASLDRQVRTWNRLRTVQNRWDA